MTIALTNMRELRLSFVLAHDYFCAYGERCACAIALAPRRRVPEIVTLAPGETVRGLSSAVLVLPDVERAIRRGRVRMEKTP